MSLFARNAQSRESIKQAQTAEPHVARRAVRYAAADNAQAAMQRQFPEVSFASLQQPPAQNMEQNPVAANLGVQDDFAQAA